MKKMKEKMKIVHIGLAMTAAIYIVIFVAFSVAACLKENTDWLKPVNTTISYMFLFLGMIFLTVGVLMNIKLSKHFPDFYKQYKCLLWSATILLTIPLFIRTAKDYAYWHDEAFQKWFEDHFMIVNTVYAILSLVLPIITQTASLVFGLMRSKENIKEK